MCQNPQTKKRVVAHMNGDTHDTYPCGSCPECAKAKLSAWLFRFEHQLKISSNPLFVTLTYDDNHLPYSSEQTHIDTATGEIITKLARPTLDKRDVQLFLKSLRKAHSKSHLSRIRYYCVGEYGTRRQRPHYHLIMFNLADVNLIQKCWAKGHTYAPPLKSGGIQYVLKYLSKPKSPKHLNRVREFSLVSQKLGLNYLTPAIVRYHHSTPDNAVCTTLSGHKIPVPKYFKEKLYPSTLERSEGQLTRRDITLHQQSLGEQSRISQLANIKFHYPELTEAQALNYLEVSKLSTTFDKRIQESF